MKNIILLFFALSTLGLNAQVGITQIAGKENSITTHGQFHILSLEVPILGSPYIDEGYKKGETLINGKTRTAALMRYNALDEAVEILDRSSQKPRKLLRRKNIAATFDGKTYVVKEYKTGNKIKLGYFNPLYEGKVSLLYRPKKKFVQAENPDHGYDVYDPPTYKDVSEYYLQVSDEVATLVKLRKKNLLRAIGDQQSTLKLFIKKHRLDLSKEADIILLLKYYNSLHLNKGAQNSGPIEIAP
jgi:hypothetical protein